MNAPAVLSAIVILAVVFVMVLVGFAMYFSLRRPMALRCPVTERDATVQVDALEAGVAEALGTRSMRVRSCSLWPENAGCGEACLPGRREMESVS